MEITTSTTIHAPAHIVADLVLDHRRDLEWRSAVTAMDVTPDKPSPLGAQVVETLRFAGRTWVTATQITQRDGTHLTFSSTQLDGTQVRGRRTVRPIPDGRTEVTQDLTIRLPRSQRLLEPLLGRAYRRRAAADLARLADHLEDTSTANA